MTWQVGQHVECDRPEQLITGCLITKSDQGSITIACPSLGIVVCGQQQDLMTQGWRLSHAAKAQLNHMPRAREQSSCSVDSLE